MNGSAFGVVTALHDGKIKSDWQFSAKLGGGGYLLYNLSISWGSTTRPVKASIHKFNIIGNYFCQVWVYMDEYADRKVSRKPCSEM